MLQKHGGGPSGTVTVTDTATEILPKQDQDGNGQKYRQYAFIQADVNNPGTVFLTLSDTDSCVYGEGIALPPGAWYEINETNLYPGVVRGISDTGVSNTVYTQIGF